MVYYVDDKNVKEWSVAVRLISVYSILKKEILYKAALCELYWNKDVWG